MIGFLCITTILLFSAFLKEYGSGIYEVCDLFRLVSSSFFRHTHLRDSVAFTCPANQLMAKELYLSRSGYVTIDLRSRASWAYQTHEPTRFSIITLYDTPGKAL